MVSLSGSSDAYRPLDDANVKMITGPRVMTAHDGEVFSSSSILGKHNLFVGRDIEGDAASKNNVILSEDVKLSNGAENVLSIGRRRRRIVRSNFAEIGEFLFYDGDTGTLNVLEDAVVAQKDGDVQIGGANGLTVRRDKTGGAGLEVAAPIRMIEAGACGWTFDLATSENDDGGGVGKPMRDLILRSDNGAAIVFSDQFTPAITNFTGQHRCVLRQDVSCGQTPPIGTVLIATGDYCGLDGQELSVDEAIPVVVVSTQARDSRVFGVLSSIEDTGDTRRVRVGNIAFERPKDKFERRVVVNGCGEGGVLVCDEGGNIQNGDFLCTSSRPGIAMRQELACKCKFTCGKATTDVLFSHDEQGERMIGCIYA